MNYNAGFSSIARFLTAPAALLILSDLYPLWGMVFSGRSPKSLGRSKNRVMAQFPQPSGMREKSLKNPQPKTQFLSRFPLVDILPAVEPTGILDGSSQLATEVVLLSLPVRLKSPHARWRLQSFVDCRSYYSTSCGKAVVERRGFKPNFPVSKQKYTSV